MKVYRWITWLMVLGYVHSASAQIQRCGADDRSMDREFTRMVISSRSTITIPLVFHVVAEQDEDDISDAQIKSQIDILNQEFAGMDRRDGNIDPRFLAVRGFANVRFCLASLDPDDQPTSGITRTMTTTPFIAEASAPGGRTAIFYDEYQGKTGWPPNLYINIWIGRAQFFGGKASFPNASPFAEEEGIILEPRYVGDIGIARDNHPFHLGKTLIHEMGHFLDLPHIWGAGPGGACGDDDGIDDTPLQLLPYTGCPSNQPISCDSRDMYINYMDNTDDACIRMFTQDQVTIMLNTLQTDRLELINNDKCPPLNSSQKIISAVYLPTDDIIRTTFSGTDGESVDITLYNIAGQVILTESFTAFDDHYTLVDHLTTGIYVVYVTLGDEVYQKMVVVY